MSKLKSEIARAAVSAVEVDEEGRLNRVYRFSADFVGFAGHFPGYSIVPAIVQVMAAQYLAESHLSADLRLRGVKNAKFFVQLRPELDITVQCRLQPREEETLVEARLTSDQALAASFTLIFSPERPTA
jgi:3-hydroxyacyl-[acyl-carrier-protein] dehydratase